MCLALQALFPVPSSNKDRGADKDRDKFIWDDLEPNEAAWTQPANMKNFLTGWARLRAADAMVAEINKADPDAPDTVVALNKRDGEGGLYVDKTGVKYNPLFCSCWSAVFNEAGPEGALFDVRDLAGLDTLLAAKIKG